MKTALHLVKLLTLLLAFVLTFSSAYAAGIETIPSGSFIVNMGVVPQTYANGLKPWGLVYDLIHNYRIQVKWIINPNKVKDGVDFTYNGTDFKGGTLIIPKSYRTPAVDSRIAYWQTQGVIGVNTTADLNLDVAYTLKYTPRWTFDFQNGKIAQNYLTLAGIPTAGYPMKDPDQLADCDDLFVMPHADPTWDTHKNLLAWTKNTDGWLWYGCHAGSVIEDASNPLDPTQQMNFLTTTGLVPFGNHNNPTPPFSYRYPADPVMQFMGTMDAAVTNGSEQVYLPKLGGGWRPGTKVGVWDPSDNDVPTKSPGEAVILAYGYAFDNPAYGKVMFQAGHDLDKGNADAVAAIRAFLNFSFLSVADKEIRVTINGPVEANASGMYNYSVSLPAGYDVSQYNFHWTASVSGTFSDEFGSSTTFKPDAVSVCSPIKITVTFNDACGREYYQEINLNNQCKFLKPPVALDRTAAVINNLPGTGAQPIGKKTPLAGNDSDGYVVNYIVTSLPAGGKLFYDHDNNSSTDDVIISSLPASGLVLTMQQMRSLKFDPNDGYTGIPNFQYTVTDNGGLIDSTPATYQIPINMPPSAQTIVCPPVNSNAFLTPACAMNGTDDGTIVSYTIVSLPPTTQCKVYLFGVLVQAGQELTPFEATQLKYQPSGTYIGYSEITYTVTDDMGSSDPTPATLTLQMVNTPPEANEVQASAISNPVGTSQFSLPALLATDVDGTIVSYTITSLPKSNMGVLYYNTTGNTYVPVTEGQVLTLTQATKLTFDPTDNFSGVATFKFTATDDGGLWDNSPATFSIPVKQTPPVTSDITNAPIYTGADQVSISALKADAKTSGATIASYNIFALPLPGTGNLYYDNGNGNYVPLSSTNKQLTPAQAAKLKFSPQAGFTGTTNFKYTATDNAGLSDPTPATFTIPVVNQAPTATDVTAGPFKDTASIVSLPSLLATDPDGSVVSYTILTLPDAKMGKLLLNGSPVTRDMVITPTQAGQLKFDPVLHNNKDAQFTFAATDNFGLVDPTAAKYTIKIDMVPYKKAPKADNKDNPSFNLKNIKRSLLPVSGSDSDGVVTKYVVTKIPDSKQGMLYVQGVAVKQNQAISAVAADQFTFVPTGTYQGSSQFSYTSVDDDQMASPEATFKMTLANAAPVANNVISSEVKKGSTTYLPGLNATDDDGSIVSYKITKLPVKGKMSYDSTGTGIYGTLKLNQVLTPDKVAKLRFWAGNVLGADTLSYTVTDNLNAVSNTANYIVNISSIQGNQVPYAADMITAAVPVKSGLTAISSLSAIDVDGTIGSYVIESVPSSFYGTLYYRVDTTINKIDTTIYTPITYTGFKLSTAWASKLYFQPSGIYTGNVTFNFRAIDNAGDMNTTDAIYTIPVANPTPTPVAFTNPAIPSSNGPTLLNTLTATDDGTIKSYIIVSLPSASEGTLVMDGTPINLNQVIPANLINRLEFTPNSNFSGSTSFSFTAVDDQGNVGTTPAVVTIPVVNQSPVADDKLSQVITNQKGTGSLNIPALTGADEDGTVATFLLQSLPTGGKLYVNTTLISSIPTGGYAISTADAGNLYFDPNDNYTGAASFTYVAKDNSGNMSGAATYQIPVNLPPVATNVQNTAMYPGQAKTPVNGFAATDDGSVSLYTITKLPPAAEGTLYFDGVAVTDLAQVDSILPSQVSKMSFAPSASFGGTTFFYTATDNMGIIDVSPATVTIPYTAAPMQTLPLNLLRFEGKEAGENDWLQWNTANENKIRSYEVEYSTNGQRYIKVGAVDAKGTAAADYQFTNTQVRMNISYYRLKIVSNDGSFTYSPVIVIKRHLQNAVISNVSPNPFHDRINFTVTSELPVQITVALSSYQGKLIKTQQVQLTPGENNLQMDQLGNLTSGSYVLTVSGKDIKQAQAIVKIR